jgi:hypothetical protein
MECYETEVMAAENAHRFAKEFDRRIGTEREINPVDAGSGYVFCVDLTPNEVRTCCKIEESLKGE